MTDREKAIVMAHTGICMLVDDKFQIFHKYVEDIMGRPIMTHEMGLLIDEIKERSKADFIELGEDRSSSEEPCEDVINRQAAQAKIKSICDEYRLSYEDGERKPATGGSAYALGHAFDDLPPATPKQKMGRWIKTPKAIMGEGYMWYCDKCEYEVYQDSSKPFTGVRP